jgi:hypothetical protein
LLAVRVAVVLLLAVPAVAEAVVRAALELELL